MTTFWTLLLHHLIGFIKNKIYHKMQREKLYNLQSKAYFNCILFVSKKAKLYVINVRRCKKSFFLHEQGILFVISYSYQLICFGKNVWCAHVIANTNKHSASGLYAEKKTIKNHVNNPKKFFFILVWDSSKFWARARETNKQIIWFDRRADALSNCAQIKKIRCIA